ncbi:MAG TPA: extracellular solute-binding protein [Anaerolineales bacterium]|nr:extracellular solute-binding protein [Anaerolineales bacterium]
MKIRRLLALCALLLAGCAALEPVETEGALTPALDQTPGTEAAGPTAGPGTPETGSPGPGTSGSGPVTLRLWLPPRFSPDPNTEAGALLKARLDEFALLHPGIRITVRIKGEGGPGGMVASLEAVAGAVPESLPDLVLISRLEMERAARAALLTPFTEPLNDDWYDYARSLAGLDQNIYGLPFAGDALVLVYRPDVVPSPPKDWTTTLAASTPLLFSAASPRSYFTLALYQAAGGELQDPAGRPFLDITVLTALLDFYAAAAAAGVFSEETALDAPDETAVYQSFREGRTDMAVIWVSERLNDVSGNIAATLPPTVSAIPYSLATGWMWSLSNPDPERLLLSIELAEFLTAPDFLARWTYTVGVLPPRVSALAGWPDGPEASLGSRLVLSAHRLPPLEVVEAVGPALQAAVEAVLAGELTAAEAAQMAATRVNGP